MLLLACSLLLPGVGHADDCTPIPGGDPRICAGSHSLVLAGRYLLGVHAAAPGSTFAEHETYLLESDDGVNWSVVSGWAAVRSGSSSAMLIGLAAAPAASG